MKNSVLTHIGLAVLRIAPSLMMLTHGYPKLMKLVSGDIKFANPIGIGEAPTLFLAVIAEFICPLLLIVGYKTKVATIPPIITMLIAGLVVHASDPFGSKEKALLFLSVFVAIFLLGPGKFSIDKR